MPKYTVYFMSPYCSWEHVEAASEDEAIENCEIPEEYDMNDPGAFMAIEEDEELNDYLDLDKGEENA